MACSLFVLAILVASAAGYPKNQIHFIGRWYYNDTGIATMSYGNSFVVKFTGSRTVGVTLSTISDNDGGRLYYVASIDGGDLKRVGKVDLKSTLQLPFQLDPTKEHTLLFGRSDEASYGKTTLHDIVLDKGYTALAPPVPRGLRYEALGDSITAGFKVTGSPAASTEDVFKTYEYYLKEHWGVEDWTVIARSGIDVLPINAERAFHEQYECASFEWKGCPKPWDFSQWTPDVVTVNLGTNDYAFLYPTPSLTQYQEAYSNLISLIRSKYPEATIFCIVPLQYSCGGADPKWATMRNAIEKAVAQHDAKVHFIPTGDYLHPWLDCGKEMSDWTHPTVEGHKKFAARLQEVLDPLLPAGPSPSPPSPTPPSPTPPSPTPPSPTPPGPSPPAPSPPSPSPSPSDCPGGTLSACILLCPVDAKYQVCVQDCVKRCGSSIVI